MFKLLKKENKKILKSPTEGKIIDLSEVKDNVFSQKIMGEGVAIDTIGDIISSPIKGNLALITETKHAFVIESENGMEVLVHIGIDTVNLKGEGFEILAEAGTEVKVGQPIIKVDREFIKSKGYSLVTPVIVTNHSDYNVSTCNIGELAQSAVTDIIKYK